MPDTTPPGSESDALAARLEALDLDVIDATDEIGGLVYDAAAIAGEAIAEARRLEKALVAIHADVWGGDSTGRVIRIRGHLRSVGLLNPQVETPGMSVNDFVNGLIDGGTTNIE